MIMQQFFIGILLSGIIASLAYWKRSLTLSGAVAAGIVGTTIYALGSIFWFGLLLAFFLSSSFLSHYKKSKKKAVDDLFAKTGCRDAMQVLANGGLGMVFVILAYGNRDPFPFMAAYLGIIATVNADTWGTEIGVLSKGKPRHILTWKSVEKGTSGGISGLGTVGMILGAGFVGCFAAGFLWLEGNPFQFFWIGLAVVSGVVGALLDSVLGATVQQMFYCSVCRNETEKHQHCQHPTQPIRGYSFFTNDMVNAISSLFAGGLAWIMWFLI